MGPSKKLFDELSGSVEVQTAICSWIKYDVCNYAFKLVLNVRQIKKKGGGECFLCIRGIARLLTVNISVMFMDA